MAMSTDLLQSWDHRERAEMWFRRAGELVGELNEQRKTASTATALAATATAEAAEAKAAAAAAKAEAAALSEKCASLTRSRKMARPKLACWLRDSLAEPVSDVGVCVTTMAVCTLLRCCPPGPEPLVCRTSHSRIRESEGSVAGCAAPTGSRMCSGGGGNGAVHRGAAWRSEESDATTSRRRSIILRPRAARRRPRPPHARLPRTKSWVE